MAYFSCGTEGEIYFEKYCSRCVHGGDREKGCPVWYAHLIHNYDGLNIPEVGEILGELIPNGIPENGECKMFRPRRLTDDPDRFKKTATRLCATLLGNEPHREADWCHDCGALMDVMTEAYRMGRDEMGKDNDGEG